MPEDYEIVESRIELRQSADADLVVPSAIFHVVEGPAELGAQYNYFRYEFEVDGVFLWARAYVDEIDKVAIFGPFSSRGSADAVSAPDAESAVVGYLKRRFQVIEQFGAEGYEVIWARILERTSPPD